MKSFSSIITLAFVVAAVAYPIPQLNGLLVGNAPETATGNEGEASSGLPGLPGLPL